MRLYIRCDKLLIMKIVFAYLAIINLVGFFIMGYDKNKAEAGEWRVAEKKLFLIALIGGALGMYLGMSTFRHKTKHWSFVLGIPFLIILQIGITLYILASL